MGSRSTIVVLVIGVGAVVVFGLLVQLAFESSPVLADVARVKKSFVEDFGERGLHEVAVRTLPKRRGFELRAIFGEVKQADAEPLSEELARHFLENYDGSRRRDLKVVLSRAGSFGCEGETVVSEVQFSIPRLSRLIALEKAATELIGSVEPSTGLRVAVATGLESEAIRIEMAPQSGEITAAELDDAKVEKLRHFLFKTLGRAPVRRVSLVVRSGAVPATIVKEAELDRPHFAPIRRARRPWRPRPGALPPDPNR